MASNLNGVVLDAPTVDPDIAVEGSFTMTIYGTYVGGGGASTHSLWLEWDQGTDTWQAIPAGGGDAGLYTDGTSSYVDTSTLYDSGNPISITVYGDAVGVFKIRAHGDRGGTPHYDPAADPWFTITVAGAETKTVDTDLNALLQKTLTDTFSIDSLLQRNIPITLSIDSILSALKIIQLSMDAKVWGTYTSDLSIDGLLQQVGIETSLSIDAFLIKQFSTISNIDALLLKAGISQAVIDALLSQIKTGTLSIDTILTSITTETVTTILDAILYELGSGVASTQIDTMLQDIGVLATLNVDALIKRSAIDTSLIDALLMKSIITDLSFDGLLLKSQMSTTALDASLNYLQNINTVIDAILYQSGFLAEVISLDALLLQINKTAMATLDVLIYKNLLKTSSIDSILRGTLARTINIDSLINGQMTSSSLLDAIIYSVLMQTGPFVEFVTTYSMSRFIETSERPEFIFQLS